MPITRRQFDMGIDNEIEKCMGKISSFLAEHKDEAFSIEELSEVCYGEVRSFIEGKTVAEALDKLVEQEVESRKIRNVYYYSWIEVLEL